MQNKVYHTLLTRLQKNGLHKQMPVVIGVSGGLDSMVLLDVCRRLAFRIQVVHVNYNLRGAESVGDMELVQAYCAAHAISTQIIHVEEKPEQANVQEWARNIRYAAFEQARIQWKASYILCAHHADDQAETLVFQMSRAALPGSNGGMLEKRGRILRPCLSLTKAELLDYAHTYTVPFRTDSSNLKNNYTRNAIRNKVLPELQTIFPQFSEHAAQTALSIQAANWAWHQLFPSLEHTLLRKSPEGMVIDDAKLSAFPYPVAHTVITQLGLQYGFSHTVFAQMMAIQERSKCIESPTHRLVRLEKAWLLCERQMQAEEVFSELDVQASVWTFDTGLQIALSALTELPQEFDNQRDVVYLDASKLTQAVFYRRRRGGDYLHIVGTGKKKKLKQALNELKMSLPEREKVRVICCGDAIVWVPGVRVNSRFIADASSLQILKLERLTKTPAQPQNSK